MLPRPARRPPAPQHMDEGHAVSGRDGSGRGCRYHLLPLLLLVAMNRCSRGLAALACPDTWWRKGLQPERHQQVKVKTGITARTVKKARSKLLCVRLCS